MLPSINILSGGDKYSNKTIHLLGYVMSEHFWSLLNKVFKGFYKDNGRENYTVLSNRNNMDRLSSRHLLFISSFELRMRSKTSAADSQCDPEFELCIKSLKD